MRSDTISELAKALSSFQGKMTAVKKDATNPFYKSKYATLDTIWETIRKPLSENGLSVAQTMDVKNDKDVLNTTLYHTSGEWISGMQSVNPVKDDPQSLGSAISYARRYSLSAILGIVADEDDDANIATTPKTLKKEVKLEPAPDAPEAQIKPEDEGVRVIPPDLKEAIKVIHWTEKTALSWIKAQFKVEGQNLTEVLNSLPPDKLKIFSDHIDIMREASGV